MDKILNKYKELIKKHKELCYKTVINNNEFYLYIISNDGPLYIKIDSSKYIDFDVPVSYDIDYFDNKKEANLNLLNISFDNVAYFLIKNGMLICYYGNSSIVSIPNNVNSIKRDAISNNKFIKYLNCNLVEYSDKNGISDLENLQRLDFINAKSINGLNNLPNLININVGENASLFEITGDFVSDTKINIVTKKRIYEYNVNNETINDFKSDLDVSIKNNSDIFVVEITPNKRVFKSTNNKDKSSSIVSMVTITKSLESLPEFLKELFISSNLKFYIINNSNHGGDYDGIKNIIVLDSLDIKRSFYHELGHAVDYILGNISNSIEFSNIFNSEKDRLYSSLSPILKRIHADKDNLEHFLSNNSEYFAECFKRYINGDKQLMSECPNTYHFINNLMINLEQDYNNNHSDNIIL